jgi:pimeloyl-ACP methyl ester carboxylesterase
MNTPKATVVLVHGAWHGSWCWQKVTPLLEAHGLAVRTVDLPSVGAAPGAGTDLSADAAVVDAALDGLDGPLVLCGHSYGGMVISRAEAKGVTRLVYLCAFMPAEGQSLVGTGDGKPQPWIRLLEGGLMLPDPVLTGDLFYNDCAPEVKEWAKSKIRPQSAATVLEPVAQPSWRRIPSTYVVCTKDMAMLVDIQRSVFAPRASEIVEVSAGHSPFLSQPQAVADLLGAKAAAVR